MKTSLSFALSLWLAVLFAASAAEDKKEEKKEGDKKEEAAEVSIFKDKNLEAGVRKYVFEKRDTTKPLTESDVSSLSTIQADGLGIKDLTGLEKCRSLASLDL